MTPTERRTSASTTEQELISRSRSGDLEAFGRLFERYERSIHRYAFHMMGNSDEADDVKQDTFIKAYRALPGFRGDCTLQTWLLKVAGNLCRDRHKQRSRRSEVPLTPETDFDLPIASACDSDPVRMLERKDLHALVWRVLLGMPGHRRELIVLRDLEELSYQQIAELLNCSAASVKLSLFRARRDFRERVNSIQNS